MSDKIFGIDLGTTNSIIGVDNVLLTSLVSSRVNMNTGKVVSHHDVGIGTFGSYKVDMGLGIESEDAMKASTIVLENLKDIVRERHCMEVKRAVISVPAYFSNNQRQAVRKAAENANIELVGVINEPTAAAINICSSNGVSNMRRGLFIVYDLGGGTFDCTIIDSRSGKYKVVATDGCICGGDDLDEAIAAHIYSKIKIPIYLKDSESKNLLISRCEEFKRKAQEMYDSFCEEDETIDIKLPTKYADYLKQDTVSLSIGTYQEIVRKVFGKTVSIFSNLISSKIPVGSDYNVVFVGGSTHDVYLCSYVLESIGIPLEKAEFDKNPDFTVAMGVVKYATSLQDGEEDVEFKDVTQQLSIEDNKGTAMVIVPANATIPCTYRKSVTNTGKTKVLSVKLYQGNSIIEAKNERLGILEYEYDEVQEPGMGDVDVIVSVDINGFITLSVEDLVGFSPTREIKLKAF